MRSLYQDGLYLPKSGGKGIPWPALPLYPEARSSHTHPKFTLEFKSLNFLSGPLPPHYISQQT